MHLSDPVFCLLHLQVSEDEHAFDKKAWASIPQGGLYFMKVTVDKGIALMHCACRIAGVSFLSASFLFIPQNIGMCTPDMLLPFHRSMTSWSRAMWMT